MRKWPCLGCLLPLTTQQEAAHICPIGWYYSNAGREHRQCKECRAWPATNFTHWCLRRKDGTMDVSKRRWDHTINAWVLDLPSAPAKFFDTESKQWVEEKDFYASSCEMPPEDWKKQKERPEKGYYGYSGTSSNYYQPCYPWEGVDRTRWPNTWMRLFFMYHQNNWYQGKYITTEDWRARLKGEYRKEPTYSYTNYGGDRYDYFSECGE